MPMLYLGCANLGQQKYRERKVSQEIIANSCWEMYNVAGHSTLPSKCKLSARLGVSEKSVQDMVLPWTGGREGFHLPLPISPSLHHWRLTSLCFWCTWSGSCDGFYDVRFIPTEQFCFGFFFTLFQKWEETEITGVWLVGQLYSSSQGQGQEVQAPSGRTCRGEF